MRPLESTQHIKKYFTLPRLRHETGDIENSRECECVGDEFWGRFLAFPANQSGETILCSRNTVYFNIHTLDSFYY